MDAYARRDRGGLYVRTKTRPFDGKLGEIWASIVQFWLP